MFRKYNLFDLLCQYNKYLSVFINAIKNSKYYNKALNRIDELMELNSKLVTQRLISLKF